MKKYRFNMDKAMKNLGYLMTGTSLFGTYAWIIDKFLERLCA